MADFKQAIVQTRKDLNRLPTFNLVMGRGNYIKSEEQKRKISRALKGRKLNKIHKENISKATKGKSKPEGFGIGHIVSKETKEKIRKTLFGRYDKTKRCVSHYRTLVKRKIGRELFHNEVVHHIDGNPLNNDLSNLQVLDRSEHTRLDTIRKKPRCFICPQCNKYFYANEKKLHHIIRNRKKGCAGPFCGISCTSKYGNYIKNGGKKLYVEQVEPEYYTLKHDIRIADLH